MSDQRLLREGRPAGGERVRAQAGGGSPCLWPALCAVAVLGVLAGSAYLLLQKFSLLDGSVDGGRVEGASAGPPRLMNMVGRAPQRVAVHLTAIPNAHRSMSISWRKQGGALPKGVDLRGNALVISIPGLYFVYAQVTFYNSGCPDNRSFLSHNLHKLSTSYRGRLTLLSSMASTCQDKHQADPWFDTSYHGAAFKLAKGDQIFSVVSPGAMAYVNSEAENTYFGLFALSRNPPP